MGCLSYFTCASRADTPHPDPPLSPLRGEGRGKKERKKERKNSVAENYNWPDVHPEISMANVGPKPLALAAIQAQRLWWKSKTKIIAAIITAR